MTGALAHGDIAERNGGNPGWKRRGAAYFTKEECADVYDVISYLSTAPRESVPCGVQRMSIRQELTQEDSSPRELRSE
jgi:hypothetical protein